MLRIIIGDVATHPAQLPPMPHPPLLGAAQEQGIGLDRLVERNFTSAVTKTFAAAAHVIPTAFVLRVFQFDGQKLDFELSRILSEQLSTIFSAADDAVSYQHHAEVSVLFQLLIYYLSTWTQNQTFGDKLHNLVYRDEAKAVRQGLAGFSVASRLTTPSRKMKVLHCILNILAPYLFRKLQKYCLDQGWGMTSGISIWSTFARLSHLSGNWQGLTLRLVECIVQLAAAANIMIFFMDGKYRSLADRICGLRLVYGRQKMHRVVNTDFLNQQIFWSVVLNFVAFVLPLIKLGQIWRNTVAFLRDHSGGRVAASTTACGLCGTSPMVLPRPATCGHLFCYYCLRARTANGDEFHCPICGVLTRGR